MIHFQKYLTDSALKILNYPCFFNYDEDRIKYTDTDSVFIQIKDLNVEILNEFIDNVCKNICIMFNCNNKIVAINKDTRQIIEIETQRFRFKYEYKTKFVIFYGKKSYIALIEDGDSEKIKISGVEGKKASIKIIEPILNDFINFVREKIENSGHIDKKDRIQYIQSMVKKYLKQAEYYADILDNPQNYSTQEIMNALENIAVPINISLKAKIATAQLKGAFAVKAIINNLWESDGKGYMLYANIKHEYTHLIPEIIRNIEKTGAKIKSKSIHTISIPENIHVDLLIKIFDYFTIDRNQIYTLILKKIKRILSPLYSEDEEDFIFPSFKKYYVISVDLKNKTLNFNSSFKKKEIQNIINYAKSSK